MADQTQLTEKQFNEVMDRARKIQQTAERNDIPITPAESGRQAEAQLRAGLPTRNREAGVAAETSRYANPPVNVEQFANKVIEAYQKNPGNPTAAIDTAAKSAASSRNIDLKDAVKMAQDTVMKYMQAARTSGHGTARDTTAKTIAQQYDGHGQKLSRGRDNGLGH